MCWNYAYLILDLEDKYVVNWNNITTHIPSVEMDVGMVNMHTLFPWSCQMLLHIYDSHMASQSFYIYQIGNYPFHQTFCFVNFDLDC